MVTRRRDEESNSARHGWSGRRRRSWGRLLALGITLLLAAWPLLALADERPYTTIDPMTQAADDIQWLYRWIFYLTIVVFVAVQGLIVYTALRFRQKRRLAQRPEQIHGNSRLEIGWTIAPAVILLAIFVFTVPVMYNEAAEANDEEGALVIDVYGKQWWWEIHYQEITGPDGQVMLDQPLITANEIRLPAGQKVVVRLHSNNVIHSFWIPQLAGKMDIMPGYVNKLAFTPEITGDYYGECAEFCGTSHAWMRFKVIVEEPATFYNWVDAWAVGAQGDLAKAPATFGLCVGCHRANGTLVNDRPATSAPVGESAPYAMGPNLTLFGCRSTLAGGLLINDQENVEAWLHNPGEIKDGNLMATQIKEGTLTDEQVAELATYLLSLRLPDGSCPPEQGLPGSTASPEAAAPAPGDVVASSEQ